MDLNVKTSLARAAKHRTVVAQLAATVSHDLGNILTLLQAGFRQNAAAEPSLAQEGVTRLMIFSDVVAGLDRGSLCSDANSALKISVFDAINAIRGAFDVDLNIDEIQRDADLECNIPGTQLTAAVYAALDAAARAARGCYPVRLSWIVDACFAGVRIKVPAAMRLSSFDGVRAPIMQCRLGLEQALALTHKFGGIGQYELTERASYVELLWRRSRSVPAERSESLIWFGNPAPDVFAMVPTLANWSRCNQLHRLLSEEHGAPRAVLGVVAPSWDDRFLLESLRWMQAAGSVLIPVVCDADAEIFVTEEFGADCPFIRWPNEISRLSDWVNRLTMPNVKNGFER